MAKGCCLLLAGIFTFAYPTASQFQPGACSIRLFLLQYLGMLTFLLQLTEDSYWGLTVSELESMIIVGSMVGDRCGIRAVAESSQLSLQASGRNGSGGRRTWGAVGF